MNFKNKAYNPLETPFALALKARITKKIAALKKKDTISIKYENLLAITIPHGRDHDLAGSPKGTNAPYYYKILFGEVLATVPAAKKFLI